MGEEEPFATRFKEALLILLYIIFLPFILLVAIVEDLVERLRGRHLKRRVKREWYPQGKRALLVLSESPVWGPYFAERVVPAVGERTVVLNWSERNDWDWSRGGPLEVQIFKHWLGAHRRIRGESPRFGAGNFNPAAVVFVPWNRPRVIRFYEAFKGFKRGRPQEVDALTTELLEALSG